MNKLNVLVVDDNLHFLKTFKILLNKHFSSNINELYEATNGKEALEIIDKIQIDLVFMDVDMPVLNGIAATKEIADNHRDVKIIAVSFHSEMENIKLMIEAGARNYILKDELNKKIIETIFKDFAPQKIINL